MMRPGLSRIMSIVDELYPEPQPLDSAEAFERAHHDDLPRLTLDEVDSERILGRLRWAAIVHHRGTPSPWLLERLARLDQAAARLRKPVAR
jgi:hypothetical protein